MGQPEIILSAHYGAEPSSGVWEASSVGLKARELAFLPIDWTPPFAVIPASSLAQVGRGVAQLLNWLQTDSIKEVLAPLLVDTQQRLIVRSSASVERLECRGWLESRTCTASLYDLAAAVAAVVDNSRQVLQKESAEENPATLSVLIQHYKYPKLYGHLSNERRVTLRSNRWLCEIETSTVGWEQRLHWLKAKLSKSGVRPGPLLCKDKESLESKLLAITTTSHNDRTRCHYEWVWDGERLWVVQKDIEEEERGPRPISSVTAVPMSTDQPKLRVFVPATQATGMWKKIESLKVFVSAGLRVANLYVLEDPKAIHALAEGRTPPRLRTDLEGLLESPIVIRTDV